eukprot:14985897-Ditylum_brightwellii.AAC.1
MRSDSATNPMDPATNPFSILGDDDDNIDQGASKPSKHPLAKDKGKHHGSIDLDAFDTSDTSKDTHTPNGVTVASSSFFTTTFEQSIGIKPETDIDNDTEWVTVNAAEHSREVLDPTKYPGGLLYCIHASGYDDAMPDLQEETTSETFALIFQSFLDTHCPVMRIVSTCVTQTDLEQQHKHCGSMAKKVFLFCIAIILAFMSYVTLDENTDIQTRAYLDMYCRKGTPSKVTHPSDWTPHAQFKLSQCNSYNPIAFAFVIGLDPNLHGKSKIELNDVTMALYLTYNNTFQEKDQVSDFLQFRQHF